MTEETHEKIFDLLRGLQKEVSSIEMVVKSHVDSSDVRIQGWEGIFSELRSRLQNLETSVKVLSDYKKTCENKTIVIKQIRALIAWIAGILGVGFAIFFGFRQ